MTIPQGGFSSLPITSPLLSPDSLPRLDTRVDFERGGVALNDPTQGYNVRDWQAGTNGFDVWVCPYPEQSPRTVFYTGSGITEVTLAFDQNMAATLAWVENGLVKLRWYDSQTASWTVTTYPGARTPMLTLDDKREVANATNDIIFAYIREGNVCYREQRSRFSTEIVLGPVPGASSRLVQLGMGMNNRLQVKVTTVPSALYADLLTDTLYTLAGEDIVGVERGPVEPGVWRSKTYIADEVPVLPWARIEGAFPVTFRLFGDGALVQATQVLSGEPFRLRAGRWREWAVEIEAATRVINLRMAQDISDF